eukprot:CAMPEP_0119528658 /NCGR_PEP_ID=MMETSP1344-20130328/42807_1 /TAXON_ID=236787 /ORGANISM="Florenciella parvula, Strain CCMP2471" /LENGTH=115 /DNA_ID=CAMNT_0007568101 /DNA_START=229 /DNA_END=573 /DNA_ORIENTATION=-
MPGSASIQAAEELYHELPHARYRKNQWVVYLDAQGVEKGAMKTVIVKVSTCKAAGECLADGEPGCRCNGTAVKRDATHYVKMKKLGDHQTGKVYEMNPCKYLGPLTEFQARASAR